MLTPRASSAPICYLSQVLISVSLSPYFVFKGTMNKYKYKYDTNPVGLLMEQTVNKDTTPEFVMVEETGPSHAPVYGYQVTIFPFLFASLTP